MFYRFKYNDNLLLMNVHKMTNFDLLNNLNISFNYLLSYLLNTITTLILYLL